MQIPLIEKKQKFVWLMIPKTGTRSLLDTLKLRRLGERGLEFNADDYKEYFIFTFVRNPWDRIASTYKNKVLGGKYWNTRKYPTFKSFITDLPKLRIDRHIDTQYSLTAGFKGVDFIGRFESLEKDYTILCKKLNLPVKELLHKNKTFEKSYVEFYDKETKDLVHDFYKKDIEILDYKFGK